MADETQTIVAPVIAPVTTPVAETPVVETVEKDLITKVSEFKKSQTATKPTDNQQSFFDYKEIEKITDPTARKFAEDAYKSMQSGFTKKTQEVAELRKQTENTLVEMQNWTPEKIQQYCLKNPSFLSAAQIIANQNAQTGAKTDEQFSALTDSEKARIDALNSKITTLEQSNFQATVAQRDSQLQTRYPDYNPVQIDNTIRDLANMNPLDIREHVYKSLKHDEDVSAAYQLGKQERDALNQTKINVITSNSNAVTNSNGKPVREKGDTDQTYFMKVALHNLAEFKNRK